MAPEVMLRKNHSFPVDYFALGVMAYELMLGRRPYVGSSRKEIKEQMLARQACVKFDQLPFKWSPNSLDFVNKVLILPCSCFWETQNKDWAPMESKRSRITLGYKMFSGKNSDCESSRPPLGQWYLIWDVEHWIRLWKLSLTNFRG